MSRESSPSVRRIRRLASIKSHPKFVAYLELIVSSGSLIGNLLLVFVIVSGVSLLDGGLTSNGVLLNKLDERLERSVTLVVDEGVRTGRLELERGETGNLKGLGRGNVVLL